MSETHQGTPRVFISYSHDSPDHAKRVLGLSERLRKDGIETSLDQYLNGTPANGWPRWMWDQIDEADFVLLICTETYYRRFRGYEEPDQGKGADWEGAVITQEIYDSRSVTTKFVPVLFDSKAETFRPEPVRAHTFYLLNSKQAYRELYDFLLDRAGVKPGDVGMPDWRPRPQADPLVFPDEINGSENPDHAYAAQPESAAETNPALHRPSAIQQERIETLDGQGYIHKLKNELIKSLSHDKLQPLISEISDIPGRISADSAVNALLALKPEASITRWTELMAVWFKGMSPQDRTLAWGPARDVHLNLFPRLIDPA